jgi:hypothetical protein
VQNLEDKEFRSQNLDFKELISVILKAISLRRTPIGSPMICSSKFSRKVRCHNSWPLPCGFLVGLGWRCKLGHALPIQQFGDETFIP